MGYVERVPEPEFPAHPARPHPLTPAQKAMLRSVAKQLGQDRPDLDTPSEEGIRRAQHSRWAKDGMEDSGIMEDNP